MFFLVLWAGAAQPSTNEKSPTEVPSLAEQTKADGPQLDLTAAERLYVRENPVFSASNEGNWPPFNFNVNGLPQGYSVDYMSMLADMAGLRVRYVSGPSWDEFERMLRNGTLDVVMNMAQTPERDSYADFTPPYATLVHGIVFRDGESPFPSLDNLGGRTVAVPKGFFTEHVLKDNYPDIKLLTPPDALGCLQAVSAGRADAAVGSLPVQNYLIGKHFLLNLKTRALVDNKNFPPVNVRFGVGKRRPMLAAILSKAMDRVGERQMSDLRQKWLAAERMSTKYLPLTPSEQQMLVKLGKVRMCVHPDWMPFSRIDEQGKFEGMTADYIRLMAERIGIGLDLTPTDSWSQSLEYLAEGRCDIIPAIPPTEERRKVMSFTRAYLDFPVVVASRQDTVFVPDIEALAGKRIGAVAGRAWTTEIRRDYPGVDLVETDDVDQGLRMVREGRLFAFVDTMAAVSYAIGKDHYTDLKIAGKLDFDLSLAVGVTRENPLLGQVFDMAVASLSENERRDIFTHWISISFEHGFDYDLFWKILAGIAVVLALVFYWNRKLVRLNRIVTQANEDLNRAHAQISALLDHSGQGFLSIGMDGVVEPEFSRECERLFGCPPAGRSLPALLHPDDDPARDAFALNIERILAEEDDYKRDLYLSLMPKRFVLGGRQVDAEYRGLGDARLMLVLTDVTDKCALEAEVERERGRLAMIVSAVRDRDDFFTVLDDFDRFVRARVRGEDVEGVDGGWDLASLYRHVHTFKGLMLQLDFILTPGALHMLEAALSSWQSAGRTEAARPELAAAWAECGCDAALASDLEDIRAALGPAFFEQARRIPVSEELLERLDELAARLRARAGDAGLPPEDEALLAEVGRLRLRDIRSMLASYPESAVRIAERAGRIVRPFAVEGDEVQVLPRIYGPLVSSLVHVFRNAVVHGVEDPDRRLEAGKDEAGRVDCRVEDLGEDLRIVIRDDGQGVDISAVREKAREIGLSPTGDAERDVNLVFERGMTTHKAVDALAGRGVGLYAVMDRLRRIGGTVRVETAPGRGTTFVFTLPKLPADWTPDAD